jgi:hypothetical protein
VVRSARNGFPVLLVSAILAFTAIAMAGTPTSPTKVVLDKLTQSGSGPTLEGHFVGHLKSPNDKCLRGRTVKLFLRNGNNDKEKLADTDKTGKRGHWVLDGNLFTIDRARIKVTRKTVGSGDHRRVCESDTLTRFFA